MPIALLGQTPWNINGVPKEQYIHISMNANAPTILDVHMKTYDALPLENGTKVYRRTGNDSSFSLF
eukprot:3994471-Prymnesium_polylepis.1